MVYVMRVRIVVMCIMLMVFNMVYTYPSLYVYNCTPFALHVVYTLNGKQRNVYMPQSGCNDSVKHLRYSACIVLGCLHGITDMRFYADAKNQFTFDIEHFSKSVWKQKDTSVIEVHGNDPARLSLRGQFPPLL